ncbi:hypothetical protein ACOMHN_020431 [Nucella lapillus]
MAATVNPQADTDLECPVCHEDFQQPKILPCTHLVCRKCLLFWLTSAEPQGGCPLCRAPVLSSSPQGRCLDDQVDDLPTDLAIQSVVDIQKFLNSSHVCSLCDDGVLASSYCLQCTIKLCGPCAQKHRRIPYLQSHVIEDLDDLTAERMAETCRVTCTNHADRLVELYCSSHQELICMLCFPTNHRECYDVKAVIDVARQKRAELKERAERLLDQEAQLSSQVQASRYQFKVFEKKVKDTFDDLEHALRKRRQTIMDAIQAEEEAEVTSLSKMEKDRAALKVHAGSVKKLVSSAANDALLGMLGKLTSRLQRLEEETTRSKTGPMGCTLGVQEATETATPRAQATSSVATLPPSTTATAAGMATCPQSSASPQPQATARELTQLLKAGYRVTRSDGWMSEQEDGGGPGSVVHVVKHPLCNTVFVMVKWDHTGIVGIHRLTQEHSELQLL